MGASRETPVTGVGGTSTATGAPLFRRFADAWLPPPPTPLIGTTTDHRYSCSSFAQRGSSKTEQSALLT